MANGSVIAVAPVMNDGVMCPPLLTEAPPTTEAEPAFTVAAPVTLAAEALLEFTVRPQFMFTVAPLLATKAEGAEGSST